MNRINPRPLSIKYKGKKHPIKSKAKTATTFVIEFSFLILNLDIVDPPQILHGDHAVPGLVKLSYNLIFYIFD